jgi:hypothetical protein
LQHSDQCHPEFEAIHPADFLVIGGGGCCATGMAKPQEVTAPTQFSQQNTVTSCCCTALFASKRATQSLRSIGATLRSDSMSSRLLILLTVTISLISAPALAQKPVESKLRPIPGSDPDGVILTEDLAPRWSVTLRCRRVQAIYPFSKKRGPAVAYWMEFDNGVDLRPAIVWQVVRHDSHWYPVQFRVVHRDKYRIGVMYLEGSRLHYFDVDLLKLDSRVDVNAEFEVTLYPYDKEKRACGHPFLSVLLKQVYGDKSSSVVLPAFLEDSSCTNGRVEASLKLSYTITADKRFTFMTGKFRAIRDEKSHAWVLKPVGKPIRIAD